MYVPFIHDGCTFIPAGRFLLAWRWEGSALSLDVARYFFGVALDPVGVFSCAGASCCLSSGWEQRCFIGCWPALRNL